MYNFYICKDGSAQPMNAGPPLIAQQYPPPQEQQREGALTGFNNKMNQTFQHASSIHSTQNEDFSVRQSDTLQVMGVQQYFQTKRANGQKAPLMPKVNMEKLANLDEQPGTHQSAGGKQPRVPEGAEWGKTSNYIQDIQGQTFSYEKSRNQQTHKDGNGS